MSTSTESKEAQYVCYRGTLVHSLALTDLEFLEDAILVVAQGSGTIEHVIEDASDRIPEDVQAILDRCVCVCVCVGVGRFIAYPLCFRIYVCILHISLAHAHFTLQTAPPHAP
jgi:hypothetical protein